MSDVVLDASAVLAVLRAEPGFEAIVFQMAGALLSTVNQAEVVGKLAGCGTSAAVIDEALGTLGLELVPFDPALARAAGLLRPVTKTHGLSLGDRACLALAQARGLPAITTDRAWAELDVGIPVRVVRAAGKR